MHDHRHDSDTAVGQVEFGLHASAAERQPSPDAAYFQIMSPMPWAAMLRYGPTLVASAARLLAAADSRKRRENETIARRLDQLENASAESARLLRDIAEQIQILAVAQEQTARKCRIAILLALVATVIGVGAGILAMVR
jgi:hypothetical protein